jgi:uncharacterized protein (TIGR02145 family)
MSGLNPNTPYFARAYATNSIGTGYGDQVSFTTSGGGGDGTFTDSRDGHVYPYKTIGNQTWMTENLAWLPSVNPSSVYSYTKPYNYVYGYNGTTVSEAKATANYTTYGVLYNWPAAMNGAASSTSVPSGVQGICPPGWHLPSDAEWTVLTDYLTNNGYGYGGSGSDIGKSMASTSGWTSYSEAGTIGNNQASNNSSGFTALPGGYRYGGGGFSNLGGDAFFWSSSEVDASIAWGRGLGFNGDGVDRTNDYKRCRFFGPLPAELSLCAGGLIFIFGALSPPAKRAARRVCVWV